MKILADTDFLIALVKADDANHETARQKTRQFESARIFITPFIIPEASTVLSYKVSQQAAKIFLEEARLDDFGLIPLTDDLTAQADHIFLGQAAKGASWIDCLNAASVRHHHLDGILSFDRFYRRMKIKML